MFNNFNNEKGLPRHEAGVSLIIVFFVMLILIAVVLSVSSLLYSEIKIIRNMSGSVISFYAADSGIEKVLYYDRNVLPSSGKNKRGLCYMCNAKKINEPNSCPNDTGDGLGCSFCSSTHGSGTPNGCNAEQCDDCTVSFSTNFGGKKYVTKATVFPLGQYSLEISSLGSYKGVGRSINVLIGTKSTCVGSCVGKACNDDNGCGGFCLGSCAAGLTCVATIPPNYACSCISTGCHGNCGFDNCGNACWGTCPGSLTCLFGSCVRNTHLACVSGSCQITGGSTVDECAAGLPCHLACNGGSQMCETRTGVGGSDDVFCSGTGIDSACWTSFCNTTGAVYYGYQQCSLRENGGDGSWCMANTECPVY